MKDALRRMIRANKLSLVSLIVIFLLILFSILAPWLTPYGEADMDLMHRLSPPSAEHLLGTDEAGRDVLTRLLYGSRVSLMVGIVPTLLSMVIGAVLGVTAGYLGGAVDSIIMRLADIVLAFPSMLLAMVIMYTLGDGLFNVFLTLTLMNWGTVARIARAETLKLKTMRHILPNCIPTLIVLFTLNVPSAILTESALSFLGLGIQPPSASWGLMVNTGRQYLFNAPWLSFAPSGAIMLAVLSFNFLGDGLRDAIDPRLRRR